MLCSRCHFRCPGFVLLGLSALGVANAATVSLPAVADAGLREVVPAENSGDALTIRVGTTDASGGFSRNRGLFRFEPTGSIPPGATITSASLTLYVARTSQTDPAPFEFKLHRLLEPWNEGVVTWELRDTNLTWSSPGGADGVDFASDASAATGVGGVGHYVWGSTTGMVADVQRWLINPAKNFGWMLRAQDESVGQTARLINTHESLTDAPVLVVEFEMPFRIESAGISSNQFCLQFQARAGATYLVESRPQVDSGAWTIVTNLPPAAADGLVTVCDSITPTNRFYRVGRQ